MDPAILRILDAGANRAREALRVLEDCARFAKNNAALTTDLKNLRHDLAAALATLPMDRALQCRDIAQDVGTSIKTDSEFSRPGLSDLITANAKRLTEALRSLEESAKTTNIAAAQHIERLRYRAYTLEQQLTRDVLANSAQERFRGVRIYVLLTQTLCAPRTWEHTLDQILASGLGHELCIQLREKEIPDGELLRRAIHFVHACKNAGVMSIINDRADIALLSGASGVHVGQTDLDARMLRDILGWDQVVGISTESLPQAYTAQSSGATYIAVGPMFPTTTKQKPRIAGPAYAAAALKEIPLPIVAIGGITLANLPELKSVGVRTIAVSSAVLRASDPSQLIRALYDALK